MNFSKKKHTNNLLYQLWYLSQTAAMYTLGVVCSLRFGFETLHYFHKQVAPPIVTLVFSLSGGVAGWAFGYVMGYIYPVSIPLYMYIRSLEHNRSD